jgi:hypothetical protein
MECACYFDSPPIPVERDLVTDFRLVVVDPRIGRVGQHFPLEIRFDVLAQRYVLDVAQAWSPPAHSPAGAAR